MSTRTVSIHLSPEDKLEIASRTNWKELHRAIGYLSSWGLEYPRVTIYRFCATDLAADYFNDNDEHAYSVTAIWHGDHYRIR